MRDLGIVVATILVLGCKPAPPAPLEGAPPAESKPFEDQRDAEDRALLVSLVGDVDLGRYTIRAAHDLGTTRMVLLDRPDQAQTVSIIDLVPPEGVTADQLRAAMLGGASDPLEVLGYDSVDVVEPGDRRARITWTRDGDAGEGTISWTECGGRWVFVGEEITGGIWTQEATSDLVGLFQICS